MARRCIIGIDVDKSLRIVAASSACQTNQRRAVQASGAIRAPVYAGKTGRTDHWPDQMATWWCRVARDWKRAHIYYVLLVLIRNATSIARSGLICTT